MDRKAVVPGGRGQAQHGRGDDGACREEQLAPAALLALRPDVVPRGQRTRQGRVQEAVGSHRPAVLAAEDRGCARRQSGAGGDGHGGAVVQRPGRGALMLALATLGFALNFWAWALLSPLGTRFKDALQLDSFQVSLLVAVPVIVGSLGRIPVGALTDRYGGRVMMPLVSAATVVPVLYLGLAGHTSLTALLIGGFFLGTGGTSFAVGVPFVNAWYPPERRGMAIGVVGAAGGLGGFVPPLVMGALYGAYQTYAAGLAALTVVAAAALAFTAVRVRRAATA
ncbi:hypothetical protein GCM10023235_69520 [Kitasatospora terrestris]|uniref:Major facilitator superfamily (MFS) profile domain-containing protein n=1 Tax=Kitasatospora terrestris TaxID=258051 RepID=A0ABP9EIL3_9ACTN